MSASRENLEFAAGAALVRLVGLLPWPLVDALGAATGALAYRLDGRHRRIARENVAAALPERPPREQDAIVRGAFRHFGVFLFELMKFSGLSRDEMARRVSVEGESHIREGYAGGRGVLLMGGHLGCWEIHALAHAVLFEPMSILARVLNRPGANRLVEWIRGRTGNAVVYRHGTIRRVLRALHDRHAVAFLIDQHVLERDAVIVDFFGRPPATTPMLAAIALRTGAAIVPVCTIPNGRGRYRLVYGACVERPCADAPDAVRELTARCTAIIERQVRAYPHLWLWMHQRWRA